MKLRTRTIYATSVMVELAVARERLSAYEIAQRQSLPVRILEQVLADLRKAGVVSSSRGPRGGYTLARPAAEITMRDIYRVTEGSGDFVPETERQRASSQPQLGIPALYWREAHQAMMAELSRTTLAELAERYTKARPSLGMYYI